MISRRPDRFGRSKYTERSKRPGRSSAGSRSAARFVAPMTRMLAGGVTFLFSCLCVGRNLLTSSMNELSSRVRNGGWSNDWSWMSSSFTTPEMPSRPVDAPMPERAAPMASISSMNPMAPPSSRAALRSALK